MKKTFLLVLGVCILIVFSLMLGWEEIVTVISRITVAQLFFMTALQLVTLFLTTYIWYFLLKQKSSTVSLSRVFGIHLAGTFLESVTPSVKVGGEALKVCLMKKETTLSYPELTAITVVSKFFSLLPFLLISFLTLCIAFFTFDLPSFVYIAFVGFLCIFGLFIFIFNFNTIRLKECSVGSCRFHWVNKLSEKLNKIQSFLKETSLQSKKIGISFKQRFFLLFLSLVVWIFYPVKAYIIASMLGYQLNPIVVIIAIYVAYLVSMIPLLPGGMATFEGTFALILVYEGLTNPEAFSIAFMTRVITFWIPLLISGVATIYFVRQAKKAKTVELSTVAQ